MEIHLNLGCGDKILFEEDKVWVNVDIVQPKINVGQTDPRLEQELDPGRPYFLQSDVTKLSNVTDNYADHIFTSHVVEHIPLYDLEDTFAEWMRVLKPGGTVAFEMPDIVKCCVNLLQMITSQDSKMINRMGLFGMYGEQFPDKPYMIHRWGWTFATLAPVLQRCGFVDIKETVPLTHMGPVRDFRIEARKPLNNATTPNQD